MFSKAEPRPEMLETGRALRTSPVYTRQQNSGGVFEHRMGFERAIWFKSEVETGKSAV